MGWEVQGSYGRPARAEGWEKGEEVVEVEVVEVV